MNDPDSPNYLTCTTCKQSMPMEDFCLRKDSKTGRRNRCRPCEAKRGREKYYRYRDKHNERTRSWKERNPEKEAKYRAEYEAKIKGTLARRAGNAIRSAVYYGNFEKKPCKQCGEPKTQFHHTNGYEKENWYVGEWLCHKCHSRLHATLRGNYA